MIEQSKTDEERGQTEEGGELWGYGRMESAEMGSGPSVLFRVS